MPELATYNNNKISFNPHPGQVRAYLAEERFVAVIAGAQSGKTSFGPFWLLREIQRRGTGDYLVVTPTFPLLEKKLLPEFLKLFQRWMNLGAYVQTPVRKFTFHLEGALKMFPKPSEDWSDKEWRDWLIDNPTVVFFGYAEDPESLESATAKAAWLDEAGQTKFKLPSWEAIRRRLALNQGRALITTTPYDLGWLKQEVWDRWKRGEKNYAVINFDSTENPSFPKDVFEEERNILPKWKFDLFYRGIFTRPAGMIYDCYEDSLEPAGHLVKRFDIPKHWPRYLGLDFGGVNTCCLFYARNPDTARLYLYRVYFPRQAKSAEAHVKSIRWKEPEELTCVGGSQSEDQWRMEFQKAGLKVLEPPIKDVEVGIQRVYGATKSGSIRVFDDLGSYRQEKTTYSRKVDDSGEPTEDIENKKSYHHMDAERYIMSRLFRSLRARKPGWRGKTERYGYL